MISGCDDLYRSRRREGGVFHWSIRQSRTGATDSPPGQNPPQSSLLRLDGADDGTAYGPA